MAPSSIAVDLPWNRLFDALHEAEQARRPPQAANAPEAPVEAPVRSASSNLGELPAILNKAAEAIRVAQARAERLEREVAAVVETSRAQVRVAEAASARERESNETIRRLELRAQTAEERVRVLEARLESVRRALDEPAPGDRTLARARPNPTVKGPQPMFGPAPEGSAALGTASLSIGPASLSDSEYRSPDEDDYDALCEAVRLSFVAAM